MTMTKLRVAVVFGGRSGEHEVSLASARSVMAAMDQEKYEIIPVGITRQGSWIVGQDPLSALLREDLTDMRFATILADPQRPGLWVDSGEESRLGMSRYVLTKLAEVDVVFPVLHGTFGEDGTLQGLLELAGIPYVGAGVLCSSLAMDKIAFKDVALTHGLRVADYLWLTRRQWRSQSEVWLEQVEARLGYPVFVKPANLGSSVGITKCRSRAELEAGMTEAARYDRRILVERAVPDAREIEVSVLGNEDVEVSIPGEIIPSREFYDYAAKYLDEGDRASQLLIPAPLEPQVQEEVQALAEEAYRAIDGAGMARVDFLLSAETGELFINEINTIPGFTSISMYPKLWEASGLSYPELIDRLIALALERFAENASSERIFRPLGM